MGLKRISQAGRVEADLNNVTQAIFENYVFYGQRWILERKWTFISWILVSSESCNINLKFPTEHS